MQLPEGARVNAAIWIVAALVGVFALARLTGGHAGAGGAPVRVERSPAVSGGRSAHGAEIYVHVAGAVRSPGLLRVPAGTRVANAVERAGGAGRRADLSGINLAARLEDGQQVVVPVRGAAVGGAGAAASAGGAPAPGGPKPSLGSATVEQLDQIDGIGPTLAQRIVEYRTQQGGFGSIGELGDVDGIGEKRLETLREALQP
jgi:competence protein ComEA